MAKAGQSWSSKEHAAHKAAHGPSGIEHGKWGNGTEHHGIAPKFVDYAKERLGNFEIKRGKTKASEFAKVKDNYRKEHPVAAEAYFGKR